MTETPLSTEPLSLVANTIRGLAMDAVQRANSGHPGMPMGMADVASVLWLRFLRYSPTDPQWRGRDRFVLSAGHGSMLLYSLLHLAGYRVSLDDLRAFRQLHSHTPGHPELGDTPGVETTTGPLGQGFANGVGMALGARMEAARFRNPALETRVFGIVSDGDLMEGISNEAASLAGHLGLSNLVYCYDDNRITIDGGTELCFSEDVAARFEALGWRTIGVDGHDLPAVADALELACAESERPTLVLCKTTIARGSPHKAGTSASHGAPLGDEEVAATKRALGIPDEPFWIPDGARAAFAERARHNEAERERWLGDYERWAGREPEVGAAHAAFVDRAAPDDLLAQLLEAVGDAAGATRGLSGKVIQRAAALVPSLVGGSADLDGSCKTWIDDSPAVSRGDASGRNLHFGVREHAMGGILNGLALHGGFLPIGSTFLVFSDYLRPSIRLAALMGTRTTFVFSHDSLLLGEDGPTHQPVEHAASLRLIPNLHVIRPADGREVAAAWTHAATRRGGPTAILLTRQKLGAFDRPAGFDPGDLLRGAHVVREPSRAIATVIATGAEVETVSRAAELLPDLPVRVVSMPCIELFLDQDKKYRRRVLPADLPTFAVEMGRPETWCRFTGSIDRVFGIERFGMSAPCAEIAEYIGFTPEAIAEHLKAALGA